MTAVVVPTRNRRETSCRAAPRDHTRQLSQPAPRRSLLRMRQARVGVRIGPNGVATVTMVRTDKHNALEQAMFEGLMNAAEQLAADASVRVVVLHGEGKSFCSGLDIASFMAGEGGTDVLLARDGD